MRFTAKSVEHIKPGATRREIPDDGCASLYLIVQPSGVKSWAVRYRYQGRPTKLTLIGVTSLAAARKAATDALHELEQGNDPAAARKADRLEAMAAKANTLANICQSYLAIEGKKLRTVDQRISILNRLVLPELGEMPIETVKRSDIVRLLDKIEARNGARMADVCLAVLRRILHWYETRTDDFRSPIIRGMGSRQNVVEHRRSRILDDDEIRKLWVATADNTPFSVLVRFLLLTSARRNEAAGMKWGEVDADDIWTLPASRSKTKVEVVRPLSKAAQTVLTGLPRIGDYPFTSNAITPIASFSGPKAALDAQSRVTGWRLHDLRRTARSLLSRAGVNSDVAEKCLGHSRGDIVERYDRHSFIPEMQHAFERLAALIETIVHPPAGEVADMAAERSKRRG
jgi:integrase